MKYALPRELLAAYAAAGGGAAGLMSVYKQGIADGCIEVAQRVRARERSRRSRAKAAVNDVAIQRRKVRADRLQVEWGHVLEAVAARNGVTVAEMLAPRPWSGSPEAAAIRESAWVLRCACGFKLMALAGVLRRDHSTIIAAARKVEAAISERPGLRDELLALVAGGRGDALVAAVTA